MQLYIPKNKRALAVAVGSANEVGAAGENAQAGLSPAASQLANDARKRKADSISEKENQDPTPSGKQPPSAGKPGSGKRSVQLFLDLGQRDFNASQCHECGMVYARGQAEDERLHKLYHANCVQGIKFQGWPRERVVLSDGAKGRFLMVLDTDPQGHVKKVQEICACIERLHGVTPGWLLQTPGWRAFLYVSAAKKVVGLAVLEPIKHAFRLAADTGDEVDSQPQAGPRQQGAGEHPSSQQPSSSPRVSQQQQQQQMIWRVRSNPAGAGVSHSACGSAGVGAGVASSSGAATQQQAGAMGAVAVQSAPTAPATSRAAAGTSGLREGGQSPAASVPVGGAARPPAAWRGRSGSGAGQQRGTSGAAPLPAADKSRAFKALAGVRMVWVSSEQRRSGLATKLLDAARCNMVLGFVVPRQQMAFSQPTEAGVQLAAAYTGLRRFLVYGV